MSNIYRYWDLRGIKQGARLIKKWYQYQKYRYLAVTYFVGGYYIVRGAHPPRDRSEGPISAPVDRRHAMPRCAIAAVTSCTEFLYLAL